MKVEFFGGLDFGTSGARISIIDKKKELKYSSSVLYEYGFKNPNSWINSCEKLLDNLPVDIKNNIINLAISGTSGTLTAFNISGEPLGEAIPYYQASYYNQTLLKFITTGEEHLHSPYSSVAKALELVNKYGENILLRHQSDWITGWFLKDWTYGEEGNNVKLGWDLIKGSWPKSYLNTSWQK